MSFPWGFVFSLAVTGVVMGLASSLIGLRKKVEIPLWWVWYASWVIIVVVNDVPKPFLVILTASILAGVFNGLLTVLFLERYKKNNPWYEHQFPESDRALARQILSMGVLIGAVFGAVNGGIAAMFAKIF